MFKRKELKKASVGDYVQMSPNKVEIMMNNEAYKKSSFSYYYAGDDDRRPGIRSNSFPQGVTQNNRINFEDAEVLYYKGDSFFSKDVAEVIPVIFKKEGYGIGGAKDFARRNKSYFVNKEDLVILSRDNARETIQKNSGWRCERSIELYYDKGIIDTSLRNKIIQLIS